MPGQAIVVELKARTLDDETTTREREESDEDEDRLHGNDDGRQRCNEGRRFHLARGREKKGSPKVEAGESRTDVFPSRARYTSGELWFRHVCGEGTYLLVAGRGKGEGRGEKGSERERERRIR